jgi:hypothetical protein
MSCSLHCLFIRIDNHSYDYYMFNGSFACRQILCQCSFSMRKILPYHIYFNIYVGKMYVSRLCRPITLVNNELNGICSCLARRSTTSTNVSDGPPLSSELKSFSEVPGPGGLYRIPYIGAALFFKPFSKYSHTCLKWHPYITKSLFINDTPI